MSSQSKGEKIAGGVCAPQGFRAAGIACGIKKPDSPKRDLALIVSDFPAVAAGVFTRNQVKAAPVHLSASHLEKAEPRAIIANSGNANACTGAIGMDHARRMAEAAANALGLQPEEVLVCSTGIIGLPMPIERIEPRLPELTAALGGDESAAATAAEAIMTSDTRPKSVARKFMIDGKEVRIGAIAKGAGMICPNMATMLCFVTTDAKVTKAELQAATRDAVERSFNRITIDGDMSTNDTVLVLANGQAGNRTITKDGPGSRAFRAALTKVMLKLAKKIVGDGERVTKQVEVVVHGARTDADAEKVARAVANSKLVKCSWNGGDPNWGRVLHAIGYSGAKIQEEMVDIYFNGLCAAHHGLAADTPLEELLKAMEPRKIKVCINLNLGPGEYNIYTSDLSPEYVIFNRAEYSLPAAKKASDGDGAK